MRIAALILGVIGGLSGLSSGWLLYAIKSFWGGPGGVFYVVAPLVGLVGGSLALVSPNLAGVMMLASALALLVMLGFNAISSIPILLLVVAACMAFISREDTSLDGMGVSDAQATGLQRLEHRIKQRLEVIGALIGRSWTDLKSPGSNTTVSSEGIGSGGIEGPFSAYKLVSSKGGDIFNLSHRKLSSTGVRIGRSGPNDITINHRSISRSHARIWIDQHSRLVIEDLGSTNGTWCNDRRVTRAVVAPPMRLRLGDVSFDVERGV